MIHVVEYLIFDVGISNIWAKDICLGYYKLKKKIYSFVTARARQHKKIP
jgi:hypothetical protein